jgi:hypothetical protein
MSLKPFQKKLGRPYLNKTKKTNATSSRHLQVINNFSFKLPMCVSLTLSELVVLSVGSIVSPVASDQVQRPFWLS